GCGAGNPKGNRRTQPPLDGRSALANSTTTGPIQEPSTIFELPFPQNKFFTGREDVLNRLLTGFMNGERVQSLNGLGGIGKTQTRLEYGYRHREKYQFVLWGNASSRKTLVTDFAAMAGLLDLPYKDAQDQSEVVEAVKRRLENRDGWLLILDNADDVVM